MHVSVMQDSFGISWLMTICLGVRECDARLFWHLMMICLGARECDGSGGHTSRGVAFLEEFLARRDDLFECTCM